MSYMELIVRSIVDSEHSSVNKVEMLGIILDMQNTLLSGDPAGAGRVLSRLMDEVKK